MVTPGPWPVVNSEKPSFMKREGADFIIHRLFVDEVMLVPTCDKLRDEFLGLTRKILISQAGQEAFWKHS